MSKGQYFEAAIGFLAFVCFIFFFGLLFSVSKKSNALSGDVYTLFARFSDIDGISVGSPVKVSGLIVGEVEDIHINEQNYQAEVVFKISKKIKIPNDSSLSVSTSGLIGSKYLLLSPGFSDVMLDDKGLISYTQSSVNIEGLVKKFAVGK